MLTLLWNESKMILLSSLFFLRKELAVVLHAFLPLIALALGVAALYNAYFYCAYRKRDMKGDVVLITGGAQGIGRLMAKEFGKLGCHLVLWDIKKSGLESTKAEVEATGATCDIYVVDVTDRPTIYETAKKVGPVDVLINNAGIVTGKKFLDCTDDEIMRTMNVNSHAIFWTLKGFLPGMLSRRKGHVVTIASAAGLNGVKMMVDYCASKFAAVGIAESLFMELRQSHPYVKTTLICPYYIGTGMFDGVPGTTMLPILDQHWMTNRIVDAVQRGEEKVVAPFCVWGNQALKILPYTWWATICDLTGVSDSMSTFRGHGNSSKWPLERKSTPPLEQLVVSEKATSSPQNLPKLKPLRFDSAGSCKED